MTSTMKEYVFIISRGEQGEYAAAQLTLAFLAARENGVIHRPDGIEGTATTWGDDSQCGAFFYDLPAGVSERLAYYVGAGMAVTGGWSLAPDDAGPSYDVLIILDEHNGPVS